ncbi:MAG: hypothetical protein AB7G39_16215 [Alphaproteobacteria bacterium]
MPDRKPAPEQKNEGEGNRTAARRYNADQQRFVASGRAAIAAEEARKAVEGSKGDALRRAEDKGRAKARETDPAVERQYRRD